MVIDSFTHSCAVDRPVRSELFDGAVFVRFDPQYPANKGRPSMQQQLASYAKAALKDKLQKTKPMTPPKAPETTKQQREQHSADTIQLQQSKGDLEPE